MFREGRTHLHSHSDVHTHKDAKHFVSKMICIARSSLLIGCPEIDGSVFSCLQDNISGHNRCKINDYQWVTEGTPSC